MPLGLWGSGQLALAVAHGVVAGDGALVLDAEDVFLTPAEAGAAGALVIAIEIGLLTPPVGLTCYVVKSTLDDPDITLGDIFQGAFPFVPIMLAVTILLVLIPKLSLVFV